MSSEAPGQPTGDPVHAFFRDALLIGGEATRLYLIRHAQSEGNTGEDLTTGDPDLTSVGRTQAERLGKRMKDARLDALYASPLRRTQATAFAIADVTGLEVVPKADLREVTLGQPDFDIRQLPIAERQKIERKILADGTWDASPRTRASVSPPSSTPRSSRPTSRWSSASTVTSSTTRSTPASARCARTKAGA